MIKLIASDLDETLLPEGTFDLNPEYFEVIRELKRKGILFVASSGRHSSSIRRLFRCVENDVVRFAGSVGSPDQQSDTYVPFLMLVDRDGHVSIKRDTDLDMHNQAADTATVDNDQQDDEQDDGV